MDEAEMLHGMTTGYWVQAWSALVFLFSSWPGLAYSLGIRQAATKKMVQERAKGKIIFVSSTLGYMSFVGYASYAPAKHAMRGKFIITRK